MAPNHISVKNLKLSTYTKMKRAKLMLFIVAFGLFISGVTVWPAIPELKLGNRILSLTGESTGALQQFVSRVIEGLEAVERDYPFLMYGYDWLAFAHICLAILFAGAIKDPVRNKWIVQCGLIMCFLIPFLAAICIPIREIPWFWFCIDFAFAPAAALPLWIALRDINHAEQN